MFLLRPCKGWTTPSCEIPSSPDTLQELLTKFTSMAWSMASESTVLLDLAWSSQFLQCEGNFFNHLWLTKPSPFMQQMFLVTSMALFSSCQIRLCCTFICVAFKSHVKWSNVQCVSEPTFNHSEHLQWLKVHQSCDITHHKLACTKILQNFWLALVFLLHKNQCG